MQTIDEKRQQLISAALAPGDDRASSSHELALRRWNELAARLAPLIGDGGFCALYGRALRLNVAEFACVTMPDGARTVEALFLALDRDLTAAGPLAPQANAKLLDTFTSLLAALIGAELTTRILVSAWEVRPNGTETKEKDK